MTRSHLALSWRAPLLAVAGGVAALVLGCSAPPERPPYAIDCAPPEGVELSEPAALNFELDDPGWWDAGDGTPRATRSPAQTAPIASAAPGLEPGRCGSERALHLVAQGYKDWGAAFGSYSLATSPKDATGFDGLAVWARAERATTRSVTLQLLDRYGSESGTLPDPDTGELRPTCAPLGEHPALRVCRANAAGVVTCYDLPERGGDDGTQQCYQTAEGQTVCGQDAVPEPFDCGNAFALPVVFTNRWTLHLIPFSAFRQTNNPNRRPEGMDTSAIHGITVAIPREARLDLWLDDITFYRNID